MRRPRILIAGTHSGAGKTTVALGLMGAYARQGCTVQPFKSGPDFIDPTHHRAVTGRASRNLDTWLMNEAAVVHLFDQAACEADLSIIEGVMGLFDGASGVDERGSAAHLAKVLAAPVLLVIDARSMARSAAAVAWGFQHLDEDVQLAGVVLNRVATSRHERYLRDAISSLTGLPVVGVLRQSEEVEMPSRHLGLVAGTEHPRMQRTHEAIIKHVQRSVDLDRVMDIASHAPECPHACDAGPFDWPGQISGYGGDERPVIAYAMDEAFYFYYQDNLDVLTQLGCRLVPFSPLHDTTPPAADLLYLGGGYPENHAKALADNTPMRTAIQEFGKGGGYIYGECGGLMYLCERLQRSDGTVLPMCGVIPARTTMTRRRQSLGYVVIRVERDCLLGSAGTEVRGHEYHYSTIKLGKDVPAAFTLGRDHQEPGKPDGFLVDNTLGSYAHVHFASNLKAAQSLVNALKARRTGKTANHCTEGEGEERR